jgi:hypothetical protein
MVLGGRAIGNETIVLGQGGATRYSVARIS